MVFQTVARDGLRHPGAEFDLIKRAAGAGVVIGVVCMNMISSFSLYSRCRQIVPDRPETVGGEDVAEIGEAAVEG